MGEYWVSLPAVLLSGDDVLKTTKSQRDEISQQQKFSESMEQISAQFGQTKQSKTTKVSPPTETKNSSHDRKAGLKKRRSIYSISDSAEKKVFQVKFKQSTNTTKKRQLNHELFLGSLLQQR